MIDLSVESSAQWRPSLQKLEHGVGNDARITLPVFSVLFPIVRENITLILFNRHTVSKLLSLILTQLYYLPPDLLFILLSLPPLYIVPVSYTHLTLPTMAVV